MPFKNYSNSAPQLPLWAKGSNTYLENETAARLASEGKWMDFMRQLGLTNLVNITDFNSPLYQQYRQYLQKTTPSVGVNSLLAPLLAGGASYAGGQNIAKIRADELNKERQDRINTGVSKFAMELQNQVIPQMGQVLGSFETTQANNLQREIAEMQSSSSIGGSLGSLAGFVAGNLLFPGVGGVVGAAMGGGMSSPAVAGYGG